MSDSNKNLIMGTDRRSQNNLNQKFDLDFE
jgi:hypothetical protein